MLAPIRPRPIMPSCIADSLNKTSFARFTDVVPQTDDWRVKAVVLEPEHADAGGATEENAPERRRHPMPAGRDHADDVAAGERQNVALDVLRPSDEAVRPGGHVFGEFAVRAAVAVEFPV